MAASQADLPELYFSDGDEFMNEKGRNYNTIGLSYLKVGEILQAMLKYKKERQSGEAEGTSVRLPVLNWLLNSS
ncbi:unnamed protein product [Bubo scandiacus]